MLSLNRLGSLLTRRPTRYSSVVAVTRAPWSSSSSSRSPAISTTGSNDILSPQSSGQHIEHRIPDASCTESHIYLSLPGGHQTRFDNQYLLDHCRCSSCLHAQTKQRLRLLSDTSPETHVSAVKATRTGLHVEWAGQEHISFFPYHFLHRASYDPPLQPRDLQLQKRILWNSKIANDPPTVTYTSLMPDLSGEEVAERGVLECLAKVHDFGFCFVSGVPTTVHGTVALIRRIGNIKETHYGGFWDFTSDMSHDTTYLNDPAGLQIFHLLSHENGRGGTTLLVDAFYTASILLALNPTAYSHLSQLRIPHHASGTPGVSLRPVISQPTFSHDERGQLAQVRWNNEDRGIIGDGWSAEDVRDWYKAARQFEQLSRSEDAEYWAQLTPGTVVGEFASSAWPESALTIAVIDNWRVMHGRSSFTGKRRMCGAYVSADDWRSRWRSLQSRFRPGQSDDIWDIGW